MIDYVNTFLAQTAGPVRPRLVCADGAMLSVQASTAHYCSPRNDEGPWGLVEVWCITGPSGRPVYPRSFGSGGKENPYGWLPVALVNKFIHRHGGLK